MGTKVRLRSRRPHNVTVPYDGESLMVPPHGTSRPVEVARLGQLPAGVDMISIPDKTPVKPQ